MNKISNTDRKIITVDENTENNNSAKSGNFNINNMINLPERFSAINKLVLRDLNSNTSAPRFYLYSKDDITKYLQNPYSYEENLRNAAVYIYGASSHFRRLIQYFVGLSDLSYIVAPYNIDTSTAKPATISRNYRKVLNTLSGLDIKNQFRKVLTVCLREDVFYGTMWVNNDSIIIQQLPSDYCRIAVIEDNVLNVSFNFSYFDTNGDYLETYPPEFKTKYEIYKNNRTDMKWQELNSPTSFAVKCNNDILNYAIPPFAGIFREIYDLEDYKQLKLTKTEIENYAILVMTLGIDKNGDWEMDLEKAKDFWRNLDNVLPEEIGSILTPMPIDKISFERTNSGDTNNISDTEESIFSAAGVSSQLFNNTKASANALLLSIKADQAITYGIVKSIEGVINRYIKHQSYGKNFRVNFLDCSPFNRKELGEAYLKACQSGLPMVSLYCASQGLSQDEMDCMNFLEDDVLGIKGKFIPLQTSSTLSSDNTGRPQQDIDDLTEQGEQSRESA